MFADEFGMNEPKNFLSPDDEHQPVLEDQNHCCLCGTELVFKHTVDYATLHVQEEAECPACMIKLKPKNFLLQ